MFSFRVPYRFNPGKMTCFAGNDHVGIMGHFFVMWKMTLTTISPFLIPVVKACRGGVTDRTGYLGMWSGLIFFYIDQGDKAPGHLLSPGPCLCMAVEAELNNLFLAIGIFGVH